MVLKTLDIGGQALHAGVIGFEHPVTHEYIERTAELPQEFEDLLADIRKEMPRKWHKNNKYYHSS